MRRFIYILIAGIGGGLIFLSVPYLNDLANAHLNIKRHQLLPYIFAAAGLIYASLHFLVPKKRKKAPDREQ